MHCTGIDRPVKSLKFLFEFARVLGKSRVVYFYGLFWGEQQPFVSSGYGGLYFFIGMQLKLFSRPLNHLPSIARPRHTAGTVIGRFELQPDYVSE
jgi:hypothetical protein